MMILSAWSSDNTKETMALREVSKLPALVVHCWEPVGVQVKCFTCFFATMLPLDPESSRIFTGRWLSVGCWPGRVYTSPTVTDDSSFIIFLRGFLTVDNTCDSFTFALLQLWLSTDNPQSDWLVSSSAINA